MTARHVIRGACHVKVLVDGGWMNVNGWTSWFKRGRGDINSADVATIRLHGNASGHVFTIRSWSPGIGANLAEIGHPLGNALSITQGKIVAKVKLGGVPLLAVRLLGAEGASGAPLLDNKGNVVGVLQQGLGGTDILGQRTSGLILGIDLASWWPNVRRDLCRAYPNGGIAGCPGSSPGPPAPAPAPSCDLAPEGSCSGFDLSNRSFAGADLDGIDFSGSDLSGSDLTNANLSGAVFEGSDLTGANLSGADLTLADLTGAHIDLSQLANAYMCQTLLPDGVTTTGCGFGVLTP
jgi:hypothetical protein